MLKYIYQLELVVFNCLLYPSIDIKKAQNCDPFDTRLYFFVRFKPDLSTVIRQTVDFKYPKLIFNFTYCTGNDIEWIIVRRML